MKTLAGTLRLSLTTMIFVVLTTLTTVACDAQNNNCCNQLTRPVITGLQRATAGTQRLAARFRSVTQQVRTNNCTRRNQAVQNAQCRANQRTVVRQSAIQSQASYFNACPTKTFSYVSVSEVPTIQFSTPAVQCITTPIEYSTPIIEYVDPPAPVIQTSDPCCFSATTISTDYTADYFSADAVYRYGDDVSVVSDVLSSDVLSSDVLSSDTSEVFQLPIDSDTAAVDTPVPVPVPVPDPQPLVTESETEAFNTVATGSDEIPATAPIRGTK